LPDLSLTAGSACIDAGAPLTQASGSGTSSTKLVVFDALLFQDGTWGSSLSDVRPDWIAIGTVENIVEIKSIFYEDKLIVLAEPKTWKKKAPVWLFHNSSGQRVLFGTAPDIGSHEYRPLRVDR